MPKSWSFRASRAMRTPAIINDGLRVARLRMRRKFQPAIIDRQPSTADTAQKRRPARAGACGSTPGGWRCHARSAAPPDAGPERPRRWTISSGRLEADPSSARADRVAEVHVLHVEEVALVQQADHLGVRPAHQQTRAGDPGDIAGRAASSRSMAGPPPDRRPGRRCTSVLRRTFRPRRHAVTPRQLRAPVGVHDPRADDRDVRAASRATPRAGQSRLPARSCRGSAAARARSPSAESPGCSPRANPRFAPASTRATPGNRRPDDLRGPIRRRVVDDDDLVRGRRRRRRQRHERAGEILARVEGDDDDRESRHGRAASSMAVSVSRAAAGHE